MRIGYDSCAIDIHGKDGGGGMVGGYNELSLERFCFRIYCSMASILIF